MQRNYELYVHLISLLKLPHIPNKGEHQIRYYGFYSNKKRWLHHKKDPKPEQMLYPGEPDRPYFRKCRMSWAALIKASRRIL